MKLEESYNISTHKFSNHLSNVEYPKTKESEEQKYENQMRKAANLTIPHANITIDINETSNMSQIESSMLTSNRQTQIDKESAIQDINRDTLLLNRISEEEGRLEDTINSNSVASAIKYKENINQEIEIIKPADPKVLNKNENIIAKETNQTIQNFVSKEVSKDLKLFQEPVNIEKPNKNIERQYCQESVKQQEDKQVDLKRKEKQKQKIKLQQKLKELEQLERMLAEKEMRSKK